MPVIMLMLCLSLLVGCHGGSSHSASIVPPDSVIYTPLHAGGFCISGWKNSPNTLITVFNPWQGGDGDDYSTLLIVRDDNDVPAGYEGQVIHGDAQRIVTMSSTHIAMLDALGENQRIAGVSGKRFISSPALARRQDKVADVGYDGNIDYEALVASQPDLVLLYGVTGPSNMEDKLAMLNIPYIYIGDYLEQHPLGKAEWVVALGEITGCRDKAISLYDSIPSRYNRLAETLDKAGLSPVKVMLNTPYGGAWWMPASDSYMIRLIKDAGGKYVFSPTLSGNSSEAIDTEKAYSLVDETDFWLNPGTCRTLDELISQLPRLKNAPCVKSGRVWNNNRITTSSGGNDFFESGIMHPDLVLADLIHIFHPEVFPDEYTPHYYIQLK